MLVNVANWLRWRRLAKASPAWVTLIQGLKTGASPKYCTNPMTALRLAANTQLAAITSPQSLSRSNHTISAHAAENNHGQVPAVGPAV